MRWKVSKNNLSMENQELKDKKAGEALEEAIRCIRDVMEDEDLSYGGHKRLYNALNIIKNIKIKFRK